MRRPLQFLLLVIPVTLGLALAAGGSAGASPADPTSRPITQPDGSTFSAHLYGDEFVNGFETAAGYTVVRDATGTWTFAEPTPDGRLRPSGIRLGETGRPPSSAELTPHLRDEVALQRATAEREGSAEGAGGGTPPAAGTRNVLVIMAGFQSTPLTTQPEEWVDLFFGPDQSVAHYYATASFGALDLQPATENQGTQDDGIVEVVLPGPHPDSGGSFGAFSPTAREIIAAADEWVDFAAYDTDGDGRLSPDELHIGIVVAGTEAAQNCPGPSVWAHRGSLFPPHIGDGVQVGAAGANGGYFTAGERQCDDGDHQATLGIWVHEFGHDLGWIDLYDIDGSSAGVDTWSVMGIHWLALPGERNGTRPPLPDPFSRWQAGWLTPTQVVAPTDDFALASSATTDEVLQVRDNPNGVDVGFLGGSGTGEYFLVENREQAGYDIALAGCGALVWHIDETVSDNADDEHRRVDVEEAGGGWRQWGYADPDDPYPSENPPNDVFGRTSSPSSVLNSGLPSGVVLRNFSPDCGPSLTLDVKPGGGAVSRPANDRLADSRTVRLSRLESRSERTVRGHNRGATRQRGEPRHGGRVATSSVWWTVVVPRSGYVELTSTSTFREVIAVYRGPSVNRLTPVVSRRGRPPGAATGSPPAPESVSRGLGFRVERDQRYHVAVDSWSPARQGGVRLRLEYDQAHMRVRAATPLVGAGQRPMLRVRIQNTSSFDRLRIDGLLEGTTSLDAVNCPGAFVLQPGRSRTCLVQTTRRGPAGTRLRGKITAWTHWLDTQHFSSVTDPWFARVRR